MNKKACYIDEDGVFKWDEDNMTEWFNAAMEQLEKIQPEIESIPFIVFLMGCEASLRLQEKEKLH